MQTDATKEGRSASRKGPRPNRPSPPATCVPGPPEACWRGSALASAWLAPGGSRQQKARSTKCEPLGQLLPHNHGRPRTLADGLAAKSAEHRTNLPPLPMRSVAVPRHVYLCSASCLCPLQLPHQQVEPAIQSRFHRAQWRPCDGSNFPQSQPILKPQHDYLTVLRRNADQCHTDAFGLLVLRNQFPRQRARISRFEPRTLFVLRQPIHADRIFLPPIVDRQISRDRIKPCAEFMASIVLMAALQHANPGFLEKVLCQLTISRQVNQITKQPMLILLDETVQQVRIAPAKAASNCAGFGLHAHHEVICGGVHATGIYGRGAKKDAGWRRFKSLRQVSTRHTVMPAQPILVEHTPQIAQSESERG